MDVDDRAERMDVSHVGVLLLYVSRYKPQHATPKGSMKLCALENNTADYRDGTTQDHRTAVQLKQDERLPRVCV